MCDILSLEREMMKVGLVSYECRNNDIEFNLSQIKKAFKESNVDLLCFGEAFLQGFGTITFDYNRDIKMAVEQDSKYMDIIKKLTIETNTSVMMGYIEKDKEDIYSSYILIDNGKVLHNYRRISKNWKEYEKTNDHYKEGNNSDPFNYKGYEMNITLCGDMWIYPKRFKTNGILIWPVYVNFDLDDMEANEYAKQAQLAANHTLLINSLSEDPVSKGGAFEFKDGVIYQKIELSKEGILVVEI